MKKKHPRTTYRDDWVEFGRALEAHLHKAGFTTHAAFAKKAEVTKFMITHVVTGRVRIPEACIEPWLQLLGLSGKAKALYLRRAYFSHAPVAALEILRDAEERLVMSRKVSALYEATSGSRGRYRPRR